MRVFVAISSLALSGCMTSMSAIREKAAQEVVLSPRAIDEIERCIIATQPGGRWPSAVTIDGVRELTILQESAGAVMLFQMRRVGNETEVTFRRKGAMVSHDDAARACYK